MSTDQVTAEVRLIALLHGLGIAIPSFWLSQPPELLHELGVVIARQAARAPAFDATAKPTGEE